MIDLEALAVSRARALAQPETEWLEPLKSTDVHEACTALTDGEIQQLFLASQSGPQLRYVFEGFADASRSGEQMAFDRWKDQFASVGLPKAAALWEQAWPKNKNFAECLKSLTQAAQGKP